VADRSECFRDGGGEGWWGGIGGDESAGLGVKAGECFEQFVERSVTVLLLAICLARVKPNWE
jgi:hypothetical protein